MNAPSALITGASRGIGRGIAHRLASQGWNLTLNARSAEHLAVVQRELTRHHGGRVHTVAADMADELAVEQLIETHRNSHQTMNALILAAGVGSSADLDGYPMKRFDKQFAVNVRAPFALVSQALPLLREGADLDPMRASRVIAVSSLEGIYPESGLSAYGASKAALISLVRSINIEQRHTGVTASAISPAYVDTDMSAWVNATIPAHTMITVEDVVKAVDLILGVSRNVVVPHLVLNRTAAGPYQA